MSERVSRHPSWSLTIREASLGWIGSRFGRHGFHGASQFDTLSRFSWVFSGSVHWVVHRVVKTSPFSWVSRFVTLVEFHQFHVHYSTLCSGCRPVSGLKNSHSLASWFSFGPSTVNLENLFLIAHGQKSWLGCGHRISQHTCACCTVMLHAVWTSKVPVHVVHVCGVHGSGTLCRFVFEHRGLLCSADLAPSSDA